MEEQSVQCSITDINSEEPAKIEGNLFIFFIEKTKKMIIIIYTHFYDYYFDMLIYHYENNELKLNIISETNFKLYLFS